MMKLYHCTLINKSGFVEENFFREGRTAKEVKEALEMFCWAKGYWRIKLAED